MSAADLSLLVRGRLASDGRAVRRVARAAWRATYAGIAPPGFVRAVLRGGYDRERLLRSLIDPARDAFVAVRGGRVVGYADAKARDAHLVELLRIYVDPDAQGGGAGHALLAAVLAAARARGARRVEAGVDPANAPALRWYARQGFSEARRDTFTLGRWRRPTVVLARDIAG